MQQVRLLTTSVLLTVFIWVAADQLATETADLSIAVTVQPENSMTVITTASDAPAVFTVSVRGRKGAIAALRDAGTLPVKLTLRDESLDHRRLGPFDLNLRDELRNNPNALNECLIQSVNPPNIPLIIDRRVTTEVPIRTRPGSLDYSVAPSVDPDQATIMLLQSTLNRIHSSNPHLTLDAETYLANQPEGAPIRLDVPLPTNVETDQESITPLNVSPNTVMLFASLRSRIQRGTIQALPIKFQLSHNTHARYDIEFRRENPDETISLDIVGPPELVDRLVSGAIKTFAIISLSSPDPLAGDAYQFFTPAFDLPEGVVPAEDQEIRSFEIRLVPRNRPETREDGAP